MIAHDHRSASIFTASALALVVLFLHPAGARADETAPSSEAAVSAASVVLDDAGDASAVTSHVAGAPEPAAPGTGGKQVVDRSAQLVAIWVGAHKRVVGSSARTVRELLAEQRIVLRPSDQVSPGLDAGLVANEAIRVTRIAVSIVRERRSIAAPVREQADATLAAGTTRTLDPGAAGLRETTLRLVRRGDARPERIVLASRIIRAPRPRVIAKGIAEYSSLARVAERGFASAFRFAGSALHMIATAYTAGCYGCSGITATGVRAGYGVIAVDPRVIPLGTKLFIPGYGRAVAGDTGGSIVGHRVDLGMDTISDAMRFGRRSVTVYILR